MALMWLKNYKYNYKYKTNLMLLVKRQFYHYSEYICLYQTCRPIDYPKTLLYFNAV